jgi:transposase InsO family protein
MAYSLNPKLPSVRREAVRLVRNGWSIRKTARHLGFHHTAVMKWVRKAPKDGRRVIPTLSSRPKSSPRAISKEVVSRIIVERKKLRRCAQVVHASLGIPVSLSTVKRTLKRYGLTKRRSKWARHRMNVPRPIAEKPGDLVQLDTIHLHEPDGSKVYVFTLIDVVSRWGYAKISKRINTRSGIRFLQEAQRYAIFQFRMLQTDHGPEFGKFFHDWAEYHGMHHRHSRVRRPNDNAHMERFNRTLQEECLKHTLKKNYKKNLERYVEFYNFKRLHLGINLKTPFQVVLSS